MYYTCSNHVSNTMYTCILHRVPPQIPNPPLLSNIGSTRIDIAWESPGSAFQQMTVTGYIISVTTNSPAYLHSKTFIMTVTNITQTSIRHLEPNTTYSITIAALSEGISPISAVQLPTDLYGRREMLTTSMLSSAYSNSSIITTLLYDFDFPMFTVQNTLNQDSNHSYSSYLNDGLVFIGSAHLQNCNSSSSCCDGYNSSIGLPSCSNIGVSVCSVSISTRNNGLVVNGQNRRDIPMNIHPNNMNSTSSTWAYLRTQTVEDFMVSQHSSIPTSTCGSSIRLTSSLGRQSGSIWYHSKQNINQGFDTIFQFEISNPSQICYNMDDVHTYCRSRGGNGFAFVLHNSELYSLGEAGSGLGMYTLFFSFKFVPFMV